MYQSETFFQKSQQTSNNFFYISVGRKGQVFRKRELFLIQLLEDKENFPHFFRNKTPH